MFLSRIIIFFLLLLPCFTGNVLAQSFIEATDSITVFDGTKSIYCNKNFYVFQDEKDLSIDSVVEFEFQENFKKRKPNDILIKDKTYWIKFRLKNEFDPYANLDRYYLYLQSPYSNEILEIYLRDSLSGEYLTIKGGTYSKEQYQRLDDDFFWFYNQEIMRMPICKNDVLTYYVKLKAKRDIPSKYFKFIILSLSDLKQINESKGYRILIYLGFLLMMFIYSFGLFSFIREKSFLYYGLFCLSLLIFHSSVYYITPSFFLDYLPNYIQYELSIRLSVHIAVFSFFLFVATYLDLKTHLPTWDKIFKGLGYATLVLFLFEVFCIIEGSTYPYIWRSSYVQRQYFLLLPQTLAVLIFLFPLWKMKTKRKYFLLLGIMSLLVGILYLLFSKYVLNYLDVLSYSNMIFFSALELIFFALGLAYRIKENELEKQQTFLKLQESENEKRINKIEKEKLEEVNELKTRFYTNITHEFRTPLTVIEGLARGLKGNKEDKGIILSNSKQLLNLVNRLLNLSKLESGVIKPIMIQSDVVAYISYITESFRSLAEFKTIELIFTAKSEKLVMDFDEEILLHIVSNLISNAIKFTDGNGVIEVSVTKKDTSLLLAVKDTGIGIPSQKIEHIFDRFYQVEDSSIRRAEGTGIGLALVKELVEVLNGDITVESEEGDGSSFYCTLPISNNASLTNIEAIENEIPITPVAQIQRESEKPLENNKPLILIVEDNKDVVHYLIKCLKGNYQIKTANTGKEGLNKAFEEIPDLIISDVMMPEMDGFELCQKLKQDKRTSHIPLILLTARVDEAAKLKGLSKGADAYLNKPFKKEELELRIKKMLELRQKLLKYYSNSENIQLREVRTIEDEFLVELREIVLNNLDNEDFDTPYFVRKSGMSSSGLHRKLTALTGKSAKRFINSVRLQKSKELLNEGKLSISQIALEVGYNDLSHFSASFKKEFGYPPSKHI